MSYVFPSDQDRADDDQLNEACERIEELMDQLASREALEGEAIGEVGYMFQPNWDDPSKTKRVALVDKSLTPGTKLYTHPARDGQDSVAVVNKASTGEYEFYPSSNLVDIPNGMHKLYTHTASADVPDGRISVHEYTARIALQALEEYAENLSIVAGWDYEPLEHHYAQQAIEEIESLLPEPPKQEKGE